MVGVNVLIFCARRLFLFFSSLIASSAIVFTLLRLLPGDLAQAKLGIQATPESLALLRHQMGLDRSLFSQYLDWLIHAIHGDLGISILSGADVTSEIMQKATVTIPLIIMASILAVLISIPLGMYAALRYRNFDGVATSGFSQLGIAVPIFWSGILIAATFAILWPLLPAGGFPESGWSNPGPALKSMILPVFTLALGQGAVLMRFARSATIDTLQQDYFRTARATGLTRFQALRIHGVRNALIPVISVLGMQIATLVVEAIIVENVFALPGIGQMLLQDVNNRDLLKVQGIIAVTTSIVFLVGFMVDIALGLLDPRVRQTR